MKVSFFQLVYLSALSMLGFIATDMYLPAFKMMETAFATGPEQIALSLTVFLVGMALGQLLWGLASDKFGHRNTLIAGLLVFTLASAGLAFSSTVWQLLLLRFIQAIGVCAPAGHLAGDGDQALPKLSQPTAVCDHHATGSALSSTSTATGCAAGRLLWLAQHLFDVNLDGYCVGSEYGLTNQ